MREDDSFRFDTHPGVGAYAVTVPVDALVLRVDPVEMPGVVHVRRIVLRTHGIPIRSWGGTHGFGGWKPFHQLIKFEEHDGVLTMESVGNDPWMEFHGLRSLRSERRAIHRWVSLAVAVACAGLHAGLTWLALSTRKRA